VKLHSLFFLFGEAVRNIRRNGLMTLAALSTVTVSLTVLGGSLWTVFRLNEIAQSQPAKFNRIDLFLPPSAPRTDAEELKAKLEKLPNVKEVTLVTKEEAWRQIEKREPVLTEALETNPLPDKLELEIDDPTQVTTLATKLRDKRAYAQVDQVVDAGEEVRTLVNFARIVKLIGGSLALGLFIATLFIIHNTIRLTVFARRREIRIMQMVGATPHFIRLPLLLEGLFHGTVGGLLSAFLMLFFGQKVSQFAMSTRSPLVGNVPSALAPPQLILLMLLLGGVLGGVASYFAIRRFVRQA
jgi:cell division transport system permease protein